MKDGDLIIPNSVQQNLIQSKNIKYQNTIKNEFNVFKNCERGFNPERLPDGTGRAASA